MSIIPNSNPFEDPPFSTSIQELSRGNPAFINSQIEWKETPEGLVLKADVAGLRKEEVKVEVEDGSRVLQIRGVRKVEREDRNDDAFHRVECSSGKFMRCFTLPANAKLDQVKASLENGVLTVIVPKEKVKNSY